VDRFGNLITNFHADELGGLESGRFEMRVGRSRIKAVACSYAEGGPGELFVVVGSSGYLEIATNQGSAAGLTGCATGAEVKLKLG